MSAVLQQGKYYSGISQASGKGYDFFETPSYILVYAGTFQEYRATVRISLVKPMQTLPVSFDQWYILVEFVIHNDKGDTKTYEHYFRNSTHEKFAYILPLDYEIMLFEEDLCVLIDDIIEQCPYVYSNSIISICGQVEVKTNKPRDHAMYFELLRPYNGTSAAYLCEFGKERVSGSTCLDIDI